METKSLIQQAVYQFLNELYQIDQTLSGNYNPNQDEDVNLTGLGELVLDKFTIEVNDPQENDVFEWVYLWSNSKGFLG
ncbi:hypothetical protein [Spirosoma litoris]|jgi:hypothetical protein